MKGQALRRPPRVKTVNGLTYLYDVAAFCLPEHLDHLVVSWNTQSQHHTYARGDGM